MNSILFDEQLRSMILDQTTTPNVRKLIGVLLNEINVVKQLIISNVNNKEDSIYISSEKPELQANNFRPIKQKNPFPKLTKREKQVLALIIDEFTTQEIANELKISFGTVEVHRRNMMTKVGARNTAGLVRISFEYKIQ